MSYANCLVVQTLIFCGYTHLGSDAGPAKRGPNGYADRGGIDGTLAMGWGSGTADYPYLISVRRYSHSYPAPFAHSNIMVTASGGDSTTCESGPYHCGMVAERLGFGGCCVGCYE